MAQQPGFPIAICHIADGKLWQMANGRWQISAVQIIGGRE
jgi:hypothetical protein